LVGCSCTVIALLMLVLLLTGSRFNSSLFSSKHQPPPPILRPPLPRAVLEAAGARQRQQLQPGIVMGVEEDIAEVRAELLFGRRHSIAAAVAGGEQRNGGAAPLAAAGAAGSDRGFAVTPPPEVRALWSGLPSATGREHGEGGQPVTVDKEKLSAAERKKVEDGWQRNAFNQYVSDMISVDRDVGDNRDAQCKSAVYAGQLPDTSVIICFHNEAWSVLLRTVHSVINKSPGSLLREIILVDDASELDHLKRPLEEYMKYHSPKVRILRAAKREGLIRARLMGARKAVGAVLTFLDSHCECVTGWLEPLLHRIAQNWTRVVTPVIEVINDDTFAMSSTTNLDSVSVGGFDWNLQFNWHVLPDRVRNQRASRIDPVPSPTMAGGLFAIDRRYFAHLGSYDPGFDIWGGENLEISFKIWMCGGTLEIVPCSIVGHVFRKRSPYSWGRGNVLKKNSVRLAEVWMDDYGKLYYERVGGKGEFGDVSERKALRQRLGCRSFQWYLDTVYPELFLPRHALAKGAIRSAAGPYCIDAPVSHRETGQTAVKLWQCHGQGGNQFWMLSKLGEIRRDEGCIDYPGSGVIVYNCHGGRGNQEWLYRPDGTIYHVLRRMCLEAAADNAGLLVTACRPGSLRQQWKWQRQAGKG
ncbi:hypothetical protein BOX15_Mlig005705g1, partial [Macrostomum lignano]